MARAVVAIEASKFPVDRGRVPLNKRLKGVFLDFYQVWNFIDDLDTGKIASFPKVTGRSPGTVF